MPKGVYPHTHIRPRQYPENIVALVRRLYLEEGMTVVEVQRLLPRGYKAQRIIERYIPVRRRAIKRDQRGAKNTSWRSDVSYAGAHLRVAATHGPASSYDCVDCGRAASDWSYDHADPDARVNDRNLAYSLNPNHYAPRCRACHLRFDAAYRKEVMPVVS